MRRTLLLVVLAALCLRGAGQAQTTPSAELPSIAVDREALLGDLRALSADEMQGRKMGTAGSGRARAYLAARFRDAGLLTAGNRSDYLFPFTAPGGRSGVNVVGRIPGTRQPGAFVVISAHYDHVGVMNGQIYNGADDNASGAAALVAIAGYFRAHPPQHSLLFAAFDGEEEGLLGSSAFVRAPPVYPESIALNINIDMIGREDRNRLFVVGIGRQPFLAPYIATVAARAPVTLLNGHEGSSARGGDWTRDSDHYSFLSAGIPALYFGVEDEREIHRPTDDYETITYPFYVSAVETIIDAIREIDFHLDEFAGKRVRP
jgi:Zn-dependent M28 family amino/carboxypeptidase